MNVLDGVIRFTQEYLEIGITIKPTDQRTVGCDQHFDQSWSCPVLAQDASKDCTKMVADLDSSKLGGTADSDLVWFTHGS